MLPILKHCENRIILASGEHLGYQYLVLNNGRGYRCGYVHVPKDHPWAVRFKSESDMGRIDVHGGITYGGIDSESGGLWVGFDCAHAHDGFDPTLELDEEFKRIRKYIPTYGRLGGGTEYVASECRSLCEQASVAGVDPWPMVIGSLCKNDRFDDLPMSIRLAMAILHGDTHAADALADLWIEKRGQI